MKNFFWFLIIMAVISGIVTLFDGDENSEDTKNECIERVEAGVRYALSTQGIDRSDYSLTPTDIQENDRGNYVVAVRATWADPLGQIRNDFFFGETTKDAKLIKVIHAESQTTWNF